MCHHLVAWRRLCGRRTQRAFPPAVLVLSSPPPSKMRLTSRHFPDLCCCVVCLSAGIHPRTTDTDPPHQGGGPAYLRMCCCIHVYGTFVRHLPFRRPFCVAVCSGTQHGRTVGRSSFALRLALVAIFRLGPFEACSHTRPLLSPSLHISIVESDKPLTISPTAVCAHMAQQWQLGCNVCSSYNRCAYARILRIYIGTYPKVLPRSQGGTCRRYTRAYHIPVRYPRETQLAALFSSARVEKRT